ncbi:MAG: branched-chain amino acid ABC transporter permease [Acidimicrobiales bacterium]|nr:branched-chain amino acid ABC transporter permease [Acidimicrobiales bacterium]MCB9373884.1 branched-chain amino acid ABC transporter permease [Microthrixaceae bacterium]
MDLRSVLDNSFSAAVGVDAVIYALAAIGLNLQFGYTGLLNFGQVGFAAVGAYGIAVSVTYFGWSLWVGLGVGLAASVVLALLLGLPTLRLRADYLAIVTIAASEIIRLVARSVTFNDYTGGSAGLSAYADSFYDLNPYSGARYSFGPVQLSGNDLWMVTVGWGVVLALTLMLWVLMRSPWGRVLKAIREDEDAVRSLGKNAYWYKMQSLIIGGMMGAVAGFAFAIAKTSVQPDNYSTDFTFFAYAALILGGAATTWGPVVGSIIFWFLLAFTDSLLRQLVSNDKLPEAIISGTQVGQVRFMLVGIGLVLLMVFRPQGIFGNKRELALDE